MPKSDSKFQVSWLQKYSFLRQSNDSTKANCILCSCDFSINTKGINSIEEHVKTRKHAQAVNAASTSRKVSDFYICEFFRITFQFLCF